MQGVIVDERKDQEGEELGTGTDGLQGVANRQRQEEDIAGQEHFFHEENWQDRQQARHNQVAEPSRFGVFIEEIVFPEDSPVRVKVIEDNIGVLDMDGPVLRWKVLECPKGD